MQKTIEDIFAKCVDTDGPLPTKCKVWTRGKDGRGYGIIKINGRKYGAHRLAWESTFGPIPKGPGYHGTVVMHKCDVRSCCNPEHLEIGTQSENLSDMRHKGRGPKRSRCFVRLGRRGEKVAFRDISGMPRGDGHWNCKLTASMVQTIVSAYASGSENTRTLASKYGLSQGYISKLIRRKAWKHIQTSEKNP